MVLFEDRGPRNNHARVVQALGMSIVQGEFSVGELLPGDADLAQRFKVSRTVLREAMKTLSAKGLVVAKARVGTRVTDRTRWNLFDPDILFWYTEGRLDCALLDQIYDMRHAIEPSIAQWAAERAPEAVMAEIRSAVDQMLASPPGSFKFLEGCLNFHVELANAAGNLFARTAINLARVTLSGIAAVPASRFAEIDVGPFMSAYHVVADRCSNGDGAGARAGMSELLLQSRSLSRSVG